MRLLPVVSAVLALGALLAPSSASAAGAASEQDAVSLPFRAAVRHVIVAPQSHQSTYERDKQFGDWIEQGQGCDTRAVVLQDESLKPITANANCTVQTGRWKSYYDGKTYTDATKLQIDHLVPVKNVWISGGWAWTQNTRVAYYNDLSDPRTLAAVDSHDNESKGDQTPDQWLPPKNDCRYVREYVSVKLRWRLTVTRAEKKAMKATAAICPNATITFEPATTPVQ